MLCGGDEFKPEANFAQILYMIGIKDMHDSALEFLVGFVPYLQERFNNDEITCQNWELNTTGEKRGDEPAYLS